MAISIVQAVPNLGIASYGQPPRETEAHRNFLSPHCYSLGFLSSSPSTSAAWRPSSRAVPAVVRMERRQISMVTLCIPLPVHLPFLLLIWSPWHPPYPESPFSCSSASFVPSSSQKVLWQKSLDRGWVWFCFYMWTGCIPKPGFISESYGIC